MNPFTLPGPQFLVFYAMFACAVLVALYLARRSNESGRLPNLEVKDPYLFACLRGGPAEVIRIATLGLVDRGLLMAALGSLDRGKLQVSGGVSAPTGWSGIDKQILDYFTNPSTIDGALKDSRLLDFVSTTYERRLRSLRLVPDPIVKRTRHSYLAAAILALWTVGGVKLWVAWMAGRVNVLFLIVLMIGSAIVAAYIANPYRTCLGSAYLRSLRSLFSQLRNRAASIRPGGGSRDVLWLTALYGAAALPLDTFPFVRDFWPKRGGSNGGSGCGGGGGGGGCGGGGGGCGGCGGGS